MKEFLDKIKEFLTPVGIPVRYKGATNLTSDFVVYNTTTFDKSHGRYQGQVVIEVHSNNSVDLSNYVENLTQLLDDKTYAGTTSAADFSFVTDNDISEVSSLRFMTELRFEYNLYLL